MRCAATLVSRAADLAIFDAAFDAFWRDHGAAASRRPRRRRLRHGRWAGRGRRARGRHAGHVGSRGPGRRAGRRARPTGTIRTWSGAETLRDQDFADVTSAELDQMRAALSTLAWNPGARRTRRWTPGRRRAHRPAPRLARERAQRRVAAAADPYPDHASAAAGAAGRRERVDGALLAHAAALRLRAAARSRSAWRCSCSRRG